MLQLVEQGKISLDDADFVEKVGAEIAKKQVFADGVNGAPQERGVTMRMLPCPIAGFGYGFLDPRAPSKSGGLDGVTRDKNDVINAPLLNQPGNMWEYGINLEWASLILERITSQNLGDYFYDQLF